MAQRIKIGLLYSYNENWIGGTYYIENLISSFTTLSPHQQPIVKIYTQSEEDFKRVKSVTNYPNLNFAPYRTDYNVIEKLINKLSTILFQRHIWIKKIDTDVDVVFPYDNSFYFEKIRKKLCWIPDMQELNIPGFFDTKEIEKRTSRNTSFINQKLPILFSSYSARQDFNKHFDHSDIKTFVLHFAVTHPNLNTVDSKEILDKHDIDTPYFICSNQFWAHKNHEVVLRACHYLLQKGIKTYIIFTGKEYDNKSMQHVRKLKLLAKELGLSSYVKFLGFVDRTEQLMLMKYSLAVIQPSLSEGWSTVVEDAKALNKLIVLSDITVHKEQSNSNVAFFHPSSFVSLAEAIQKIHQINTSEDNYSDNIYNFAKNYLDIIKSLCSKT